MVVSLHFIAQNFLRRQYMKKLLFVLACAASLGLWISCNNEAQELDVTLHSGVDTKKYDNSGKVTAKKVTMVTKRGAKVALDDKDKIIIPTDRKDYYIGWVETLSEDGKKLSSEAYWFYNEWDSGEDITFDKAYMSWEDNVSYYGDGASSGKETVSNGKTYKFSFGSHNDVVDTWHEVGIMKSGNVYQYDGGYRGELDWDGYEYCDSFFGTTALDVSGNLEGDFTIGILLKKLDSLYGEKYEEEGATSGWGDKYRRLDARTEYEPIYDDVWIDVEEHPNGGYYDYDVIVGYEPRKISANTSVYYLTNVSFTKN